eukprot:7488014-Pyramimonas_sp.AAC.1
MHAVQRAHCGIPHLCSLHAQPGQGDAVPQRGEGRPRSSESGRVLRYIGREEGLVAFTASAVSTAKMSSSSLNVVAPVSTRCHRSSRRTQWTRSRSFGRVRHGALSM